MAITPITQADVRGKRILVRADLNVPVEDGRVTDTTRIDRFAAGMRPLLDRGARLVILTHYGRPKPEERNSKFSVDKLRPALSRALGVPVRFSDVCADESAVILSKGLKDGEALLCENLRYDAGEAANSPGFAAELSRLGDLYVNDAFSCAHRAHSSTDALAGLLPAYAGPLLMEEIAALSDALEQPAHPAVAIVGGAKVSSKIAVLKNLVTKLDHIIIGGGMANTFLCVAGAPMGKSLHEADQLHTVTEIQRLAKTHGCTIHLPKDVVVAQDFKAFAEHDTLPAMTCPSNGMILDAGPQAVAEFSEVLERCQTILWNGPLGAFEMPPFDRATIALAKKAAELTRAGRAVSVAGGGDTVAALNEARVAGDFTYVSTAGGAFLEWLEGKELPGIAALRAARHAA